ncbi:MAG: DEAD/DEAH box helicase, partial [Bdellovibrionales bacterium]|nr:DEAD/DEAH box helicase [Bdellovibrionales bacterium]
MKSFEELELSNPIVKAIKEMGFEEPSAIQKQALPILQGEPTDFIGQAATGTGKTAAFGIPLLEKINVKDKSVQGIILCPTRELAKQVATQLDLLGKFLRVSTLPIYGGAGYGDQIKGLRYGCQIVVGTPGRVIDHIKRGTLNLSKVQTVILDEADEMISMGFKEDLETILEASPRDSSQIWLFSATLSREVRRVADTYLRDAKQVSVNNKEMLSGSVEQVYYSTRESDKPEILCKLIESVDDIYGIIFCQIKALVTDLTKYLAERGYKVDSLHGDKSQSERENTMQAFRDRKLSILVCTDVASRGLDVKDLTHVINYSIPRELDIYVHRIGRTARGGNTGIAMSLVTPKQRGVIDRIEKMTKSRIKLGTIPTRKDVAAKKVSRLLVKFQEQKFYPR